jgi:UTP--glucose-1-phosphate uridylyltransferase
MHNHSSTGVNDDATALPTSSNDRFAPFALKMQQAGLPALSVQFFHHYYDQLVAGATGFIDSTTAGPVSALPNYDDLSAVHVKAGEAALARTIVLKLNGGLGTSMGMDGPKALLPVKDGLTFLDIIVRQILHLRRTTAVRLPLVLMNSFVTHKATMSALEQYDALTQVLPLSFVQSENPKIWAETLAPAVWPEDPSKEWCPPGHGDIYASLVTSGMLSTLLQRDYEYAFVSNADNLGAVLDPAILGYFAHEQLPFLMEVADRTPADHKGGHLAQRPDGQLILRELSQCPPDETDLFQDIERYRYFNTNNLWLHLPSLQQLLVAHKNLLDLPLIRNEKPIDPTQPTSPRVYQLETAMGSALALFRGAQAMRVPRSRFIPVKKCNDLLLLWSDVYELSEEYLPHLADGISKPPLVVLDDANYALIGDLRQRFAHGAPSLVGATALRVNGNVHFGRNVTIHGDVCIDHPGPEPLCIPDDAHLT